MKPKGLGFWVAFESAIDAGPKARDLEVAIERCRRTGAGWVALRAGDGCGDDGSMNAESIRAFVEAGIAVYLWKFIRPNKNSATIAGLAKWLPFGISGAILNAEFEYQSATRADALALVAGLRAAGFDYVAHAPPDYLGGYGATPSLVALDEVCDAIMPQIYAHEHNDEGHEKHLERVMGLYAKRGYGHQHIQPILCSYRPKVRGFDAQGKAKPTPTMPNEAEWVARDLVAGLNHPLIHACEARSIYSLDAITFINGPADRVIDTLAERYDASREPPDVIALPADPRGEAPFDARDVIENVVGFRLS